MGNGVRGRLFLERGAWLLGLVLLGIFGTAELHGRYLQQRDLTRFHQARASLAQASGAPSNGALEVDGTAVDQSLWSESRVAAHRESLSVDAGPALAVLRIPGIGLEVAVLDGTDEWTLNRAVGHIEGTARPGEAGNIGIAGHRDGFFRALKDIATGDRLELLTATATERYVVETTRIVLPEDVDVLQPTTEPSVTLVTCYPFYYVGSAPKRFIVRAVRQPENPDPDSEARDGGR